MRTASDIEQFDQPVKRIFQASGHMNGAIAGVNLTIEADSIEEAQDEAEERLDTVTYVREVNL